MLKSFRIIVRLSLLSAHLVTGVLLALVFLTRPLKSLRLYNPKVLIKNWLLVTRYFTGCRLASKPQAIHHPTLLLSNHVSWLDILVLGGTYDVHFLSKEEVKDWPIIGFLTVISGTLLIKRGSGSQGAIEEIIKALNAQDSVGLFPEGTTSNGYQCKAFHSRLLKSAYLSSASISLVSLSYSSDNTTRDKNMGWEKQSFFQHLWYVLGQKTTWVKLNNIVQLNDFKHMPRKALAQHCQQLIDEDLQRNHYPCE